MQFFQDTWYYIFVFLADHASFSSSFIGDNSLCKNGLMQTNLIFNCDKKAKWNTTVTHNHGGASSPHPVNLQFDAKSCKVSIQQFSYAWQLSFVLIQDKRCTGFLVIFQPLTQCQGTFSVRRLQCIRLTSISNNTTTQRLMMIIIHLICIIARALTVGYSFLV